MLSKNNNLLFFQQLSLLSCQSHDNCISENFERNKTEREKLQQY